MDEGDCIMHCSSRGLKKKGLSLSVTEDFKGMIINKEKGRVLRVSKLLGQSVMNEIESFMTNI